MDNIVFTGTIDGPPLGWDYHQDYALALDGPNQWAVSSPIAVQSGATTYQFSFISWSSRDATEQSRLWVEALSGKDFGTVTLVSTLQGSAIQGWQVGQTIDLASFSGQEIKLRFRVDDDGRRQGRARIDNVELATSTDPPSPSTSACTVYVVDNGAPTEFTTPNEPYIVRLLQRRTPDWVTFQAGDTKEYLGAGGDAIGGDLPRNAPATLTAQSSLQRAQSHLTSAGFDYNVYVEVCRLGAWQELLSFRPSIALQNGASIRFPIPAPGQAVTQRNTQY